MDFRVSEKLEYMASKLAIICACKASYHNYKKYELSVGLRVWESLSVSMYSFGRGILCSGLNSPTPVSRGRTSYDFLIVCPGPPYFECRVLGGVVFCSFLPPGPGKEGHQLKVGCHHVEPAAATRRAAVAANRCPHPWNPGRFCEVQGGACYPTYSENLQN